jgi:hypothetical protein
MPPITAATIATIAMGAERLRTDRTVAASVLDLGAENSLELGETFQAGRRASAIRAWTEAPDGKCLQTRLF